MLSIVLSIYWPLVYFLLTTICSFSSLPIRWFFWGEGVDFLKLFVYFKYQTTVWYIVPPTPHFVGSVCSTDCSLCCTEAFNFKYSHLLILVLLPVHESITESSWLCVCIWWLILTVNLTGSSVSYETSLWACLWGIICKCLKRTTCTR